MKSYHDTARDITAKHFPRASIRMGEEIANRIAYELREAYRDGAEEALKGSELNESRKIIEEQARQLRSQERDIARLQSELKEARGVTFRDSHVETVNVSPGDTLQVETTLRSPGSFRRERVHFSERPVDPNDALREARRRGHLG